MFAKFSAINWRARKFFRPPSVLFLAKARQKICSMSGKIVKTCHPLPARFRSS